MVDIQTMRDASKYNNINIILKLILKTGWEGVCLDSSVYGQAKVGSSCEHGSRGLQ